MASRGTAPTARCTARQEEGNVGGDLVLGMEHDEAEKVVVVQG
jgi:hypothetical protein